MTRMEKVLEALSEVDIRIVKMRDGKQHDGECYKEEGIIRIHQHSAAPFEMVLLHECLHYCFPQEKEMWVRRAERREWGRITREELNQLRLAVQKAKRRK